MTIEEGTGKTLEVAEMGMLRRMCGVPELDMIRNERIRGQRNRKVTPGKDVEVAWACDEKRVMRDVACGLWSYP